MRARKWACPNKTTPDHFQENIWSVMAAEITSNDAVDEKPSAKTVSLAESLSKPAWSITRPRIFDLLSSSNRVLVAGCGGGYDILSGLPLFFALLKEGKKVFLANLSFTNLQSKVEERYCEMCVKVTHTTKVKQSPDTYFPEYYLSRWFWEKHHEDVPVYTFWREIGVHQMKQAYEKICSENAIDAIVLVDGGTDSLMFGYEERMGTPTEDQTSIVAVNAIKDVPMKLLCCIGFGVDSFHGVSHGLFLENVATLEKNGGYFGCFSIPQHSIEGQLYLEGYQAVQKHMQPSIVCASITDALQGHFGNYHSTSRTGASKLFINPLMPIFWTFDLRLLVAEIRYADELLETKSATEVMKVIMKNHAKVHEDGKIRKPIALPM